jgi:hypothetical protein
MWHVDLLLGRDLETNNEYSHCLQQASNKAAVSEQQLDKCSYKNDIHAIARQLPITTIRKLLKVVFSVGFTLRLYIEDPRLAE